MADCRLTALLVYLFVLTGGSQGFTVEPDKSNLYVSIGGDAVFTVRPSSAIGSGNWVFKSKTIVQWLGTNTDIPPVEYKSRVDINVTTGSLVLRSVNESDNGVYTVSVAAVGGAPQDTATITLQALEPVANVDLRSNNPEPVEQRDPVVLTCNSRGTQVKREWLLNHQPIQQNDRITISGNTLIIAPVNRADAGMYKCIVRNGVNSGSDETYLVVLYGPDNMEITPQSPVTITNGENLTLTCSAQSVPSPVYEWFNGAERLSTGPVFTIPSVRMEHAGKYTCHANNARTGINISLTVNVDVQSETIVLYGGLGAGGIVGIACGVVLAAILLCVLIWYFRKKYMNRPNAEPGTKYEANRSPTGQTASATDAEDGMANYENIPGKDQGATHAPEGDPTYMGLKLEDRSVYSELRR
ncbi:carcinoembryonic antigen-related cell adhesion molecule 5-like isoform X2 [Leucoraja erinacea]|uniref:carcinoembryonic antigen-related cell adhesion molecule 5-like isoform X2 n=1 Tax=Leucoraja erinaceus TaxID=7782 RepID=UPI0024555EAA|nr:carcinoembryonic antigen-related cell adhesion molecule 5-like isoform X2 [Leucoraja erinacea]